MGGSSRSGSKGKSGGQRGNLASGSGRKQRSTTSTSHKGSRVEPSHTAERSHNDRARMAAGKAAKKKAKG